VLLVLFDSPSRSPPPLRRRYGFSSKYEVRDAAGNTIGTTNGNTFGNGYIELTDTTTANGTVVARASWNWATQ
jgi:hypothetical protein